MGHEDGGRAVPATDVGHIGAGLELGHHAIKGREPLLDQMGVVTGPEEPLAALMHIRDVVVPGNPGAGSGDVHHSGGVVHRSEGDLEEAGQVGRAGLVGQGHRLLGRQNVATAAGVVFEVAAGRLGVEPLSNVALGTAAAGGHLSRRQRSGAGQGSVQAELVAHDHQSRVQGGTNLIDGSEHEAHQLVHVDIGTGGHDSILRTWWANEGDRKKKFAWRHRAFTRFSAKDCYSTLIKPCLAANRLANARLLTSNLV